MKILKLKKRYIFLWTTIIIIASAAIFYKPVYKLFYPDYTYRYRLTVEIDTPDGVKSGSSVIEVHTIQWPKWLKGLFAGNYSQSFVKGEAVFVDLGDGKNVVALLARGPEARLYGMSRLAQRAFFSFPRESFMTPDNTKKLASMLGEDKDLNGELIPTLISLSNVNDSKTAKVVYANELSKFNGSKTSILVNKVAVDNMATLGKGVSFKRAYISITNDEVTNKIIKRIPFLITYDPPFSNTVNDNNSFVLLKRFFIEEEEQQMIKLKDKF